MKATVLMSVRNEERFLDQAMESLAGQTLRPDEILIYDDGSCDSTPVILRKWKERLSQISVVRNDTPCGLPTNLNRGLRRAKNDLIARFDGDDVCLPRRLEQQISEMQSAKADVLCSGYSFLGRAQGFKPQSPGGDHDEIYLRYLIRNPICHPAVMYRRDSVLEAGGYDEEFFTAQDTELWGRMLNRYRFCGGKTKVISYRIHESQSSRNRPSDATAVSLEAHRRGLSTFCGEEISEKSYRGFRSILDGAGSFSDCVGFWRVTELVAVCVSRQFGGRALQSYRDATIRYAAQGGQNVFSLFSAAVSTGSLVHLAKFMFRRSRRRHIALNSSS